MSVAIPWTRIASISAPRPVLFSGEQEGSLGGPSLAKGTLSVEWRCVSALERFHDEERGARLSDAWHQLIWPGETGLANMTGIEKTSYWGVEKPPSGVTYGAGGGAGRGYFAMTAE